MKILPCLIVSLLALLGTTSTKAQNCHFLPGDAFFSISITRDVIKRWIENPETSFDFRYARFDGRNDVSGNLGYTNLNLQGIDPTFRNALTQAYWKFTALERPLFRLETDDQEILTQTNGVVALIYGKEFKGSLGLKFNENWQIEGLRSYGGFFQTASPVIEDWRVGPEHPPLALAEPIPPLAHIPLSGEENHPMATPIVINAADIKIVFVGFAEQDGFEETQTCPQLQAIYDSQPGAEYIKVHQAGFTSYSCNEKRVWSESLTAH